MASKFILASLLSLAAAQSSTITATLIGYDGMSFSASLITARPEATTIALKCPESLSSDCGLFPEETVVIGPSTFSAAQGDPSGNFTATADCKIASSTAVCVISASGTDANFPGLDTETFSGTDIVQATIVITAGADKLTAGGSAASASASASASAKSSAASAGKTSGSAAASKTGSAAATGASQTGSAPPSTTSNAAAGNAVVIGGGLLGVAAGVFGGLIL